MCKEFITCIDRIISLAPLPALTDRGFSSAFYGMQDFISAVGAISGFIVFSL
jgi:hypothetical protein